MNGDPTLPIRRPKRRDPERRTFSEHDQEQIIRACMRPRDLIGAGLILSFGLRKGEWRGIQMRDFQDGVLTVRQAGVPHLQMHAGRHTALTRVWRATGDLELVRQLAGYGSISTTADIYVHANIHDLERGLRAALDRNHSDRKSP